MADRYMYLPGIGLYIAMAWGARGLRPVCPHGDWPLAAACRAGDRGAGGLRRLADVDFGETTKRCGAMPWHVPTDNSEAEYGLANALRSSQAPSIGRLRYFRRAVRAASRRRAL